MLNRFITNCKRGLFISPLLFFILLNSCKQIEPIAPENKTNVIPDPPKQLSIASVPVTIDLIPYLQAVEKEIPKTFSGKEQKCEGVSFDYTFWRDPIQFSTLNSQLNYSVDGRFALKLNYCPTCTNLLDKEGTCISPRIFASCGINEPKRRIHVSYSTSINISEQFKFVSSTKLTQFETLDPCQITLFQFDATKKIKEEVQVELKALEKQIDKELSSYPLRTELESIWSELGKTSKIAGYGYFNLVPTKIKLSDIKLENKKAYLVAHIGFYPKFSTSQIKDQLATLPNQTDFAVKNGFEVYLDTKIGYDSLTSILQRELAGDTIWIKKNHIRLDSIQAYGSDDKMILSVLFSGSKNGKIYLTCTPTIETIKQELIIENVDFDIQTRNVLLKTARWLLEPTICRKIAEKGKMSLSPYLQDLQKMLTEELNTEITDGVELKGVCKSIQIESCYIDKTGIISRVKVLGSLEVKM